MALDVFREMSQLKKRLASLNGLTQVHENREFKLPWRSYQPSSKM